MKKSVRHATNHLPGERNGERIGIMFYIAVRDAGEINLK